MRKDIVERMVHNISLVMQQDNIPVAFQRVIEGPQALLFYYRLPIGVQVQRSVKNAAFRSSLSVALERSVLLRQDGAYLIIEASKRPDEIITPKADFVRKKTSGLSGLCLGMDVLRNAVIVNMRTFGHILFIGPTGRGKTEAAKSYLWALSCNMRPSQLQYVIVARKSGTWQTFAKTKHIIGDIVTDEQEMIDAIGYVHHLMNLRAGDRKRGRFPAVILMLDDMINLSTAVPYPKLEAIASMGLAVNVFIWISTQTDGKNGGMTQPISANMRARIVFGGTNAGDASRFAGRGGIGAEFVGQTAGDAMLVKDGWPTRIVTPYAGDVAIQLDHIPKTMPPPWNRQNRETGVAGWGGRATRVGENKIPPSPPDVGSNGSMAFPGADYFPIDINDFDSDDKELIDLIQRVYDWTSTVHNGRHSLSHTSRIVFGYKNGRTYAILKNILVPKKRKKWIERSETAYNFSFT